MKKHAHLIPPLYLWVLFLYSISSNQLFAQDWQFTFDQMSKYENSQGVPTKDGGYATLGSDQSGLGGLGLLKVDASGELLWYESFPDFLQAGRGKGIIEEEDGRLIIVGNNNSLVTNDTGSYFLIVDANGNSLSHQFYGDPGENWKVEAFDRSHDGGFVITGKITNSSGWVSFPAFIMLVDSLGNELVRKTYGEGIGGLYDIKQTSDGGYIAGGAGENSGLPNILKVNGALEKIWSAKTSLSGRVTSILEGESGNFYFSGIFSIPNTSNIGAGAACFDNDGNEIFNKIVNANNVHISYDIELAEDGNLLLLGGSLTNNPLSHCFLSKIDLEGNLLWNKLFQVGVKSVGYDIDRCINGQGYIINGGFGTSTSSLPRLFLLKTNQVNYAHYLKGNIFNDFNFNCIRESGETGYKKWIVKAEGDETFFAITQDSGYYSINLPPDDYTVSYSSPSPYLQTCQQDYDITIPAATDTFFLDLPTVTITECPFLTVDISTPRLRRCRENQYFVSFCNYGPAIAKDAYVEVLLDEHIQYLSASLPLIAQNNQTYTFEIGDVDVFDCGSFVIQTSLDCDSTFTGQTHCVAAHIYPDTLCLPIEWTGPIIEVEGACTPDSINFLIKNVGGNMSTSHDYIVIEDNIIMRSGDFNLPAGGTKRVDLPNQGGSVYHIEAEQDPNLPIYIDDSLATFTLNGCSEINMISDFFNWFAENDQSPFISIDCEQSVASYDPNDKRAYPRGFGDEHLIAANTEMEYKINFQNTGTDTAFQVVLEDVISPFLRPESIILGASSHPYQFQISKGGQISFTFDNILLPDSSTNEVGSRGFVKFKIQQQQNNPIGTKIWNEAAIYFDFNPPIITNKTLHTIGEDFILVVSNPTINPGMAHYVKVYPNPFHNQVTFEVNGGEDQSFLLMIYDVTGHLIQSHSFNTNQFELQRNQLVAGIYIYEIRGNDVSIDRGKIIVR